MAFDLKKNNPVTIHEAGHTFEVVTPDGVNTGIKMKVRGSMSEKVRKFYRTLFTQQQMKEAAAAKRNRPVDPMTIEESEEVSIRSSALRVISWEGIEEDGKEVPYTPENCIRLMTEYSFLREAVTRESEEVLNFRTE
jgi:hypothetical protein